MTSFWQYENHSSRLSNFTFLAMARANVKWGCNLLNLQFLNSNYFSFPPISTGSSLMSGLHFHSSPSDCQSTSIFSLSGLPVVLLRLSAQSWVVVDNEEQRGQTRYWIWLIAIVRWGWSSSPGLIAGGRWRDSDSIWFSAESSFSLST